MCCWLQLLFLSPILFYHYSSQKTEAVEDDTNDEVKSGGDDWLEQPSPTQSYRGVEVAPKVCAVL